MQNTKVIPPIIVKEISPEEQEKIDAVQLELVMSGLPLLGLGVDPPTGKLTIQVDIDKAEPDTEQKIRAITRDIPLILFYKPDTATLQGSLMVQQDTGILIR